MDCHEIANLFPEMSGNEFRELSQDISRNGLIDPIWTHEGLIIDGKHRYRACLILGIEPRYQEWAGECGCLGAFVASKNLHRRHMLDANQRAAIAAELKPMIQAAIREELKEKMRVENNRRRSEKRNETRVINNYKSGPAPPERNAQREAAEAVGANVAYVHEAERIMNVSPRTFKEIKAGRKTIPEARRELGLSAPKKPKHGHAATNIEVPRDPSAACRVIVNEFDGDQLEELIRELANWAGFDLVRKR